MQLYESGAFSARYATGCDDSYLNREWIVPSQCGYYRFLMYGKDPFINLAGIAVLGSDMIVLGSLG